MENVQPGTFFLPFSKQGKIKDIMTDWEKNQQRAKTEKCKRWVHACDRREFTLDRVTKHTKICSLHFIGGNGPTEENPDPTLATLSVREVARKTVKRKTTKLRDSIIIPRKTKRNHKEILEPKENIITENSETTEVIAIADNISDKELSTSSDVLVVHDDHNDDKVLTKDTSTQTVDYSRTLICSKVENLILRNEN